jgi:hypothetical protein
MPHVIFVCSITSISSKRNSVVANPDPAVMPLQALTVLDWQPSIPTVRFNR